MRNMKSKKIDLSKKKILIAGASGFLGKYVVKKLEKRGVEKIYTPRSSELDLRHIDSCKKAVKDMDIVIHLAAKVGGIGYNRMYPAEMFYDNLTMSTNLFHESWRANVEKFVAIGTVCCYPKFTPVPFKEENLWNGYPEETNAAYGLSKKMILVQAQAYRQQYNFNGIFLLPVNLYGPGDNFDPDSSHVIPSLIRKIYKAKLNNEKEVTIWGSGRATREFLFVEDAAEGVVLATQYYNKSDPVNLGSGFEISIKNLAILISSIIGFKGKLTWDKTKPDGQPRRKLDIKKAKKEFYFKAETSFEKGLKNTIKWYEKTLLER